MFAITRIVAVIAVLLFLTTPRRLAAQDSKTNESLDGWLWQGGGDEKFWSSGWLNNPYNDAVFLLGLREVREPTRRLCEQALARVKTDRSFDALSKQVHDQDWRFRYQAVDVLGNSRQPRCVAPLLDALAHDPEPLNRAVAAVRLENYPEDRVKSALLQAMQDDVEVAQAAAFALGGMNAEAAIGPTVDLLRANPNGIDRGYVSRALGRYTSANARERIAAITKNLIPPPQSRPGAKPAAGAKPEELVFHVKLHAASYRVGDPISIDFLLENRSVLPARTIPPQQLQPSTYGIRLERLNDPRMILVDSAPVAASEMFAPRSYTLKRGETFLLRDCLHAWLTAANEGAWPLAEGKYRLTVTFDNSQFPEDEWPRKDDTEAKTATAGKAETELPKVTHRWEAKPVEFTISGPARTGAADLLDFIGSEVGRPDLRESLASKYSHQRDDHAVCLFGDARLTPLLASKEQGWFLDGMGVSSFFFTLGSRDKDRGSLARPSHAAIPADKPVIAGPEGLRAFKDLANYDDQNRDWSAPWMGTENEMKPMESPVAAERAKQARYILASAAQSLADEYNGRGKWRHFFGWGGGMESPIRELRGRIAGALAKKVTAAEALEVAVWLIENDPVLKNESLGSRVLCQIDAPQKEAIYRRILAQPHTNELVLLNILAQVTMRKLTALKPEVIRLTGHYRKAVRTAATNAAIELGVLDPPRYRPEDAFSPWLDGELRAMAAMAEVPISKDAPWKAFAVARSAPYVGGEAYTETIPGWLLGETADAYDVLAMTGNRIRLEKKITKAAPCSLQETARDLMDSRNAPARDRIHSSASRFSRMGSLTSQFEPQFISAQEALVAAWLYQRGDKKAAAELIFPRIDATGDDRQIREAVQELLGNSYHLAMLGAFADERDYDRALVLAKHLSGPLFDGYWYQDRAKELAEQLPKRRDDFKSFRLPSPKEWSELKKKLTRSQQIEYLAKRLRLLKGVQFSQPGGVTYEWPFDDPKAGPVINPYTELRALKLDIADLPALVPFLADETYTLTYGYWRNFHPGRDLHRVNRPVAEIINEVARRDLAQLEAYSAKDVADKRKHIETILQWCREHGGQTREQFLLKTMAGARTWEEFAPSASEAVGKKVKGTMDLLVKRFASFPQEGSNAGIAKLCYQLDAPEAAAPAIEWLEDPDPAVRYWAALILLRHGGKPEGVDVLARLLADDDGTHKYPGAVGALLAMKSERAAKLACGILKKQKFDEEPGWIASPVLQRLFMAGRQECLDYLLAKLDSKTPHGGSSGEKDGKRIERSLVKGDDMALAVARWRDDKSEYDTLASDEDRRQQRKELKAWLKDQFSLIKAGKKPKMKQPEPLIESSGPFLDAP